MSDRYVPLLYITPSATRSEQPTDDELTYAMEAAFDDARVTTTWRGWHTCACGERSTNRDYAVVETFETNSLCVHYLRWHRHAVPVRELNKVRGIAGLQLDTEIGDRPPGVTFLGRPISEWNPADLQRALDDVAANSQWSPRRSNGSGSVGLFQVRNHERTGR